MNKKDALVLLLQDSLMVTDVEKKKILYRLDTLSSEQINILGKFLSYEQVSLIKNKEKILKQVKLLMNTLELAC